LIQIKLFTRSLTDPLAKRRIPRTDSAMPATDNATPEHSDLTGRADIERLVNAFYDRVRQDDLLGFIFNDIAKTDWSTHLPKCTRSGRRSCFGAAATLEIRLAAHSRLAPLTMMGRDQFDRWLTLFKATVDALFSGENAEHIKRCAEDMANVIHGRINQVPDPRFDPANLTPEQRARYAQYKATAASKA
jgi:hemoglobin